MTTALGGTAARSDLQTALAAFGSPRRYRLYRDYYHGVQRQALFFEKVLNAFGGVITNITDNFCAPVVDAIADKMVIDGFEVEQGRKDAVDRTVDAIWKRNRLPKRSGEFHTEALEAGDSYLIVWPDADGKAQIDPQKADLVRVWYDDNRPGLVSRAAKWWKLESGLCRLNLYYPDRIEKFITVRSTKGILPGRENMFAPYAPEGEEWPLENTFGIVPVFPLGNNSATAEDGESELRDILPIQDLLNKAVADLAVAMEHMSLPQRWGVGIEVPIDPETGKPIKPFEAGADKVWTVANPEAKFGQFDPANLEQFIKVHDSLRTEACRLSATPLHYFMLDVSGGWPSGEAQKTAEARHLAKIRDRTTAAGQVWSDVMAFAVLIESGMKCSLETRWKDPAPVSELIHLQTLQAKSALGVPQQKLWQEMGYTDEEIRDMLAMKMACPCPGCACATCAQCATDACDCACPGCVTCQAANVAGTGVAAVAKADERADGGPGDGSAAPTSPADDTTRGTPITSGVPNLISPQMPMDPYASTVGRVSGYPGR